MSQLRLLLILLLIVLPLSASRAQQDVPPQLALALASLSTRLGVPLTVSDLDSWTFQQNIYTDTAMGCPFTAGTQRPQPFQGFIFTLVYQGATYDYRVAADGSLAFACEPAAPQPPPQPTTETNACPSDFAGYLPPRLQEGGQARIGSGGTANRLRADPSIDAQQIGLIQPGTTVSVLGGPSCEESSHIVWWQVNDDGVIGWTAEGVLPNNYFLSPVGASLPAERSLITTDTVGTLVPLTTISLAGVSSIAFRPDGQQIALAGLSGLAVYDMGTLNLIPHLGDISQPVTAVAFSRDGHYLAYSKQDGTLNIEDTATRASLNRAPNSQINSLAFSSADLLAFGSGSPTGAPSSWEIFDLASNHQLSGAPTGSWVRAVAFSPDGTLLAWMDTSLHVIDVQSGAEVRTVGLTQAPNGGLAWRPAPLGAAPLHQIAFADGELVRMVDMDTNVEQTYSGDPGFYPGAISFSKDGSLLAAMDAPGSPATASTVNLFDATTSDLITSTPLQASESLVFSPDGTLLVIASDDEVVLLGISTEAVPAVG